MATKTLMSLDEFLKLPEAEEDGTHYELDEGELILLSPSGFNHGFYTVRIGAYLDRILDPNKFTVASGEVGIILSDATKKIGVRGADVAVLARPANEPGTDEFVREPFAVAIEIVSKDASSEYIERKTYQYLQGGVQEVWLVYPSSKRVHVHRQNGMTIYNRQDFFECLPLGVDIEAERFFTR